METKPTREQVEAFKSIYDRPVAFFGADPPAPTYLQFRRTIVRAPFDTCYMVPWLGMWLGVERDGYTHS